VAIAKDHMKLIENPIKPNSLESIAAAAAAVAAVAAAAVASSFTNCCVHHRWLKLVRDTVLAEARTTNCAKAGH